MESTLTYEYLVRESFPAQVIVCMEPQCQAVVWHHSPGEAAREAESEGWVANRRASYCKEHAHLCTGGSNA